MDPNGPEELMETKDPLPDGGTRVSFGEGMAVREGDTEKARVDGISPYAMHRLGMLFTRGGIKYKDFRNWEKGMPTTRYIGAIIRHVYKYLARDTTEDHLAAVMWNAAALMHHEAVGTTSGKTFADIDDRPHWDEKLGKEKVDGT